MNFNNWLDTFINEKDLDLEHLFEVEGPEWGANMIPLGCVIEVLKAMPTDIKAKAKFAIIKDDFNNKDPLAFFNHLATGMAK